MSCALCSDCSFKGYIYEIYLSSIMQARLIKPKLYQWLSPKTICVQSTNNLFSVFGSIDETFHKYWWKYPESNLIYCRQRSIEWYVADSLVKFNRTKFCYSMGTSSMFRRFASNLLVSSYFLPMLIWFLSYKSFKITMHPWPCNLKKTTGTSSLLL